MEDRMEETRDAGLTAEEVGERGSGSKEARCIGPDSGQSVPMPSEHAEDVCERPQDVSTLHLTASDELRRCSREELGGTMTSRIMSSESAGGDAGNPDAAMGRLSTPMQQYALYATGYRPTSSEVAAEIEGFDDDFNRTEDQVIDESEPGALAQSGAAQPPDESQEEASSAVGSLDTEISQNAPAASERLNAAAAKRLNQLLHKAIREALGHGTAPAARGLEDLGGVSPEERYQAALSCWSRLEEERAAFSDSTATQLAALEAEHTKRLQQAESLERVLGDLITKAAEAASPTPPGQSALMKAVQRWLTSEESRNKEVEALRLRVIHLQRGLATVQRQMADQHDLFEFRRVQEKLADGLHLIDFEQLRSENQTLNEKIQERNLELASLRKKLSAKVAELTHVKEKLYFEEAALEGLHSRLDEEEAALGAKRDEVAALKWMRDKQRSAMLATNTTVINDPLLLNKLKVLIAKRELREEIRQLEARHATLTAETAQMKGTTLAMTRRLSSQGLKPRRGHVSAFPTPAAAAVAFGD